MLAMIVDTGMVENGVVILMIEGKTPCPYKRYCYVKVPCDREDFYECVDYFHIDDIINDARDIEEEQRKGLDDFYNEWE